MGFIQSLVHLIDTGGEEDDLVPVRVPEPASWIGRVRRMDFDTFTLEIGNRFVHVVNFKREEPKAGLLQGSIFGRVDPWEITVF